MLKTTTIELSQAAREIIGALLLILCEAFTIILVMAFAIILVVAIIEMSLPIFGLALMTLAGAISIRAIENFFWD